MHGFDAESRLVRVATPLEVIAMHKPVRLRTYEARRVHELAVVEKELLMLDAKARFLELVCAGQLTLGRVSHSDLVAQLQRLNFAPLAGGGGDGDGGSGSGGSGDYSHLLGMPLQSLTEERLVMLSKRRETRCMPVRLLAAPALPFCEVLLTRPATLFWQTGKRMPIRCGASRQSSCGCASWKRSGLCSRLPSKDRKRHVCVHAAPAMSTLLMPEHIPQCTDQPSAVTDFLRRSVGYVQAVYVVQAFTIRSTLF